MTIAVEVSNDERGPTTPSPASKFLYKVCIVTGAAIVFFYVAFNIVTGFIENEFAKLTILTGGPTFWNTIETKLYKFADAPDLPPEKRERILQSLRKISAKYQPYIDAIKEPKATN